MKEIIMYSSKAWHHCSDAKEFLREKGYAFTVKDLDEDKDASMDFMKRKLPGLPVFFIEDDIVVGFYKDKIERLMDYKLLDCPSCHVRLRIPKDSTTCPKCEFEIK